MKYDKPYLSFEDQVKHVQEKHNLTILDFERAVEIMQTFSYYDLINGYIKLLTKDSPDGKYPSDISLDTILSLYMCDREIQNFLFSNSVLCETRFKNILSNAIARSYGVHQDHYLAPTNYKSKHKKIISNKLLDRIRANYAKPSGPKEDYTENPTRHYRDRHNHIPPWILFKNTTFNDVIDLYQILTGD